MAEAGWYPDPSTDGQVRYWDGAAWTEHVRDLDSVGAAAAAQPEAAPAAAPAPHPLGPDAAGWGAGAGVPSAAVIYGVGAAPAPMHRRRSHSGLVAAVVVALLAGGGAAAYFAFRDPASPSRSSDASTTVPAAAPQAPSTTAKGAIRPPAVALAQRSACLAEVAAMREAAVAYHAENGAYPTSNQQLLDSQWLRDAPKWYQLGGDGSTLRITPTGPCVPVGSN